MSLRLRLPLTYLLLIAALLAGMTAGVIPILHRYLRDDRAAPLQLQGTIIANDVRPLLGSSDLQGRVAEHGERLGTRVLVLSPTRRVLADSHGELVGQELSLKAATDALQGQSVVTERQSGADRALYVITPIGKNQATIGAVFISTTMTGVYQTLAELRQRIVWGSAGVALVAALASLWLAATITAPLASLTQAVERFDLSEQNRVPVHGDRELRTLAMTFNQVGERLHAEDEIRRRFITDVSHELRTPLAALKSVAETMLSTEDLDPALQQEFLRDIDHEVDRLAGLVKSLFELSQLDRRRELQLSQVDLGQLAARVAKNLHPLAQKREIDLKVEQEGPAILAMVDEQLLYRALFNLADNAIKFSPDGGRIWLRVRLAGANAQIAVTDEGPGIAADEHEQVFKRFYRVDASRARATGGSGLGLAMAREIAIAHRGEIILHSELGQGSTFTVIIPTNLNSLVIS